jgi:ATP-binding cassette subfamily B protein
LEQGYDTIIGEGGSRLSGGEKQRISIARALLKNAPIILLDEVTANVDVENEQKIQMALQELLKNRTVIMIAHKLSTIRNVDQILVIEDGKISQRGNHDELAAQDGLYKRLWDMQRETSKWKV